MPHNLTYKLRNKLRCNSYFRVVYLHKCVIFSIDLIRYASKVKAYIGIAMISHFIKIDFDLEGQ